MSHLVSAAPAPPIATPWRTGRIPDRYHFFGGLSRRVRRLDLPQYLSLASCLEVNRPETVYFHYRHEPTGYYWEQIKERIVPVPINAAPPRSYLAALCPGADPDVVVKRLDFTRLSVLLDQGGIAVGADTLFVKRLPDRLFEATFVLGEIDSVPGATPGESAGGRPLSDEWIMAERNSAVARDWLGSLGRDQRPPDRSWLAGLGHVDPESVLIEPPCSFFKYAPTPSAIGRLMRERDQDVADVLALQPWTRLWSRGRSAGAAGFARGLLTENYVRRIESTYCIAARPYLPRPQPRFWLLGHLRDQGRNLVKRSKRTLRREAFGAIELGKVVVLSLFGKWIFPDDTTYHLNFHRHQWRHRGCLSRFETRSNFEADVVKNVAIWNEYGLQAGELAPEDVVIDVGAHVGSFCYLAYKGGSRNVYGFEPEIENFRRLATALSGLPGIRAHNLSVFRSDVEPGYRLVHSGYRGEDTGGGNVILGGRLFHSPDGSVLDCQQQSPKMSDVVAFDEVLARFPRVKLVKLDCEGSEFPILLTSRELHRVGCILGEYHELDSTMTDQLDPQARLCGVLAYRADVIKVALESAGFRVVLKPTAPNMGYFKGVRAEDVGSVEQIR